MLNTICKKNCASCFAEPVCAVEAITTREGAVYVETEKCIGCGSCRTACITFGYNKALKDKTVEWLKGVGYTIDAELCNGCGLCRIKCPEKAVSGEKKKTHAIDHGMCVKCGICFASCKFGAILVQ